MGSKIKIDIPKSLIKCAILLHKNRVFPKRIEFSYYKKLVLLAHNRGYLYVGFDKDDIDLCCIAYKVPEVNFRCGNFLPERESGHNLYVLALASNSNDRMKVTRLMRHYLMNNEDVNVIAYNYRGSDEHMKKFNVRDGVISHGK